jgi:hypothetical protein
MAGDARVVVEDAFEQRTRVLVVVDDEDGRHAPKGDFNTVRLGYGSLAISAPTSPRVSPGWMAWLTSFTANRMRAWGLLDDAAGVVRGGPGRMGYHGAMRRPACLFVTLTLLVVAGQLGAIAVAAERERAPAGIDAALWRDLRWLPSGITFLGGFRGQPDAGILGWVASLSFAPAHPCIARLSGLVDRHVLARPAGRAENALIFIGRFDFADVQRCASEVMAEVGGSATLDGDLLTLRAGDGASHLGATADGARTLLVADEPEVVRSLLARGGGIARDGELLRLIARADTTAMTWFAARADYGSKLLGVKSTGISGSVDAAGPGKDGASAPIRVRMTLRFETARDASRGAAAVRELVARLDPADRKLVENTLLVRPSGTLLEITAVLRGAGSDTAFERLASALVARAL